MVITNIFYVETSFPTYLV